MISDLGTLLFFIGLEGRSRRWVGPVLAVQVGGALIGCAAGILYALGHGSTALVVGGALAAAAVAVAVTAPLVGRRAVAAAALAATLVEVTSYLCVVFLVWFKHRLPTS